MTEREFDELPEEAQTGFRVEDDRAAEWAVNRIREHRAAVEMWKQFYSEQLDRIRAREERSIEYLEGLLRGYFERVPKHETKTQARYTLPNGELILRAQRPEYTVDEEKVIAYFQAAGGAHLKTEVALDWAGLKKTITAVNGEAVDTETGEIIPGITITDRAPKFEVKIK